MQRIKHSLLFCCDSDAFAITFFPMLLHCCHCSYIFHSIYLTIDDIFSYHTSLFIFLRYVFHSFSKTVFLLFFLYFCRSRDIFQQLYAFVMLHLVNISLFFFLHHFRCSCRVLYTALISYSFSTRCISSAHKKFLMPCASKAQAHTHTLTICWNSE